MTAPAGTEDEANAKRWDEAHMEVKWALWDAGFCGEQSAERGPVMMKATELVIAAEARGAARERERSTKETKLLLELENVTRYCVGRTPFTFPPRPRDEQAVLDALDRLRDRGAKDGT